MDRPLEDQRRRFWGRRRVIRRHYCGAFYQSIWIGIGYAHITFRARIRLDPVCLHHWDSSRSRIFFLVAPFRVETERFCIFDCLAGWADRDWYPQIRQRTFRHYFGNLLRCGD